MNKSEIELQNIESIIREMPAKEQATCVAMIQSLMASVGNPIHGQTFMIAVAHVNCQVAVHNIKMGLVNEDGSEPEKFMQGDGKVSNLVGHVGGYAGELKERFDGHKGEVLAVDECPVEQGLNAALEAKAAQRLKTLDKEKLVSMGEMQARYANDEEKPKNWPIKPGTFEA